jgi:hypothetical protein
MAPELVEMGRTSRKRAAQPHAPALSTLVNGPRAWKTRLAGSSCNREGQTGAQLFRRVFKAHGSLQILIGDADWAPAEDRCLADASVSASLPGRINEVCCLSGADNFALEPADPALSFTRKRQGRDPYTRDPLHKKNISLHSLATICKVLTCLKETD